MTKSLVKTLAFGALVAAVYACSSASPAAPSQDLTRTARGAATSDSGTQNPGDTTTAPDTGSDTTDSTWTPPDTGSQGSDTDSVARTLSGRVLGWAANDTTTIEGPVSNAEIVVTAYDIEGNPTTVGSATSDAAGHFAVGTVPPGALVVDVTPPAGSPYLPGRFNLSYVNQGDIQLLAFLRHR
jgi:hypothetical protein